MKMPFTPPRWADRFLAWYCNPELLEEIQGDIHELYFERLHTEGKRMADLKFAYDVLRFFRWSNIRGDADPHKPSRWNMWRFNWKIAMRTAGRHKVLYAIKTLGVSVCLAFALILTAFVMHELSYDKFNLHHESIYRVTSRVDFHDHITHYAVTPLPIGQTMLEGIPEVERYTRFMNQGRPVFRIQDKSFYTEETLTADSNFLKLFSYALIEGHDDALNEPNNIVLTETTARKFFGSLPALNKQVRMGGQLLQVSAVIEDVPANSHLQFDALISWSSFQHWDDWGNLNAYTYVRLKPKATLSAVKRKMPELLTTFHELVEREYKATYEPVFEPLTAVHFSDLLDEDVAQKGNINNVFILSGVIVLLLLMGIINYVNLSMVEVSANIKKFFIVRIFSGTQESHQRLLLSDALLALSVIIPSSALLVYFGWRLSADYLSIVIEPRVIADPLFWALIAGCVLLIVFTSQLNATIFSGSSSIIAPLKGMFRPRQSGHSFRNVLVGAQFTASIVMIALILVTIDQFNFIQDSDKGFESHSVLLLKMRHTEPEKVGSFVDEVRLLNGVASADGSTYAPGVLETKYVFRVEGSQGMTELLVPMIACGYDYFNALNIKITEGRQFDIEHRDDPHSAFIINETAAREFGWTHAIGKKISGPVGGEGEASLEGEVIGVVRDFNFASLHSKVQPLIIFLTPEGWSNEFVYIKTNAITPPGLMASIRKAYDKRWEGVPFEWEHLESQYQALYKKDRQVKHIFEVGLIISLLIATLGVFSISALLANLRAKEMGIRKVVGANHVHLFLLHLRSFVVFLIACVIVAWPLTFWLSDIWLSNFAYHIRLKPYHFLMPGAIAAVVLLLTVGYHAIRGTKVNPVQMLKCE